MNALVPQIGWLVAFGAGVVSFFSPCVAPLIPGYLAIVTGQSTEQLARGSRDHTLRALRSSLLFVLGFVIVFVLLGIAAAALGGLVGPSRRLVNQITGLAMILMGFFVLEVIRLPLLYQERKVHLSASCLDRPRRPSWAWPLPLAGLPALGQSSRRSCST